MKNIVVTGAAGFIGSNLVRRLNDAGFRNLLLVDNFSNALKGPNLEGTQYTQKIDRNKFINWFDDCSDEIEFVFHLGARTDTAEFDFKILDSLNLNYTKAIWKVCSDRKIPLLYASSAATYGIGEKGFSDEHSLVKDLKPLNPYGMSKQLFDLFALEQKQTPPFWCGLKFFNVYGRYENHKGRMASVVFHAYNQIRETGKLNLFKSHRADFKDGEQLRDFIYVDDVVDVCLHFYRLYPSINSGIYNVGSGAAETFNRLADAVFKSMNLSAHIEYIPIPEDIRDKYQYFTEADINKLRGAGFEKEFVEIEAGVEKYLTTFVKS